MADLAYLLRTLQTIKAKRAYERRVHGTTKQYKQLTAEYHKTLADIGKATE